MMVQERFGNYFVIYLVIITVYLQFRTPNLIGDEGDIWQRNYNL